MTDWNTTSPVFATIWITLKDLKQLKTSYGNSGSLKMSDLTFYNTLSSDTERSIAAKMLAVQIDNILIDTYRCEYETNENSSTAVSGIVEILINSEKTVADLAAKCDDLYKFLTES